MDEQHRPTHVADELDLKTVISGLAKDLADLRAGHITAKQAATSADVAKQLFNGVRLYLQGFRLMEQQAKRINAPDAAPTTGRKRNG